MKLFTVLFVALAFACAVFAQDEAEAKKTLADALRKQLETTVGEINSRVNRRQQDAEELLARGQSLVDRLKQLGQDVGDSVRKQLENAQGQAKSFLERLRDRVGKREKRQADDETPKSSPLADALRAQLARVVERIKERVNDRQEQAGGLLTRATELIDRLRQLREDVGKTVRDQVDANKDRGSSIFDRIRERIAGLREKRDVEAVKQALNDIRGNAKDKFAELADWLKNAWAKGKENLQTQKERMTELAKSVRDNAKEMRQNAVREAIEALRPHKEQLGDLWKEALDAGRNALGKREKRDTEAVKKALEDIRGNAAEKFADFADWVRRSWSKGRENLKTQRERLTELAKETRDHASEMSKQAVQEAVDALRPHREQLGNVWTELVDAARTALGRKTKQE